MRTIAHLSDLHFGRHDPAKVEELLASLAETKPDLVAISGDFTQRARTVEFTEARRFLDRLKAPKLAVPGNHDMPLYDVVGRMQSPFAKYDRYILPASVPNAFFRDSEIAVLGLNTARRLTGKNGRVSFAQMTHIGERFAHASGVFKIVVTHHPLASPQTPLELAWRSEPAWRAVLAAGVHLLLSGHHHRAASGAGPVDRTADSSCLIVHAGTAVSARLRGGEGNSFNLIRIVKDRLEISVMGWSPAGFRPGRTLSYVFRDGRWLLAG